MSTLTIRTATPAELPELGRLTVTAYSSAGDLPADDPYLLHLADPASRSDGCDLLVAADGERLVGGVTFVHPGSPNAEVATDGEAEVRTLAVLPDAQGRGVGATLVTACLDRARAAGLPAVALCVVRENATAHRLYQRFGFTRTPERDWSPNAWVDLQAYRLDLRDR